MAIHYMKAEGGLHQRVWFAKAGRGAQDIGIAPPAERQLENGTYSFSLSAFDPRRLSQKEAVEEGRAKSLYQGMGAQFGAQVWRMAHEAAPYDYIFLESENHNLHAIGVITGRYLGPRLDYDEASLAKEGIHAIPVRWSLVPNGIGAIQLGRLDNAVFRNVIEKDDLMECLFDLTQPYVSKGLYSPGEFCWETQAGSRVQAVAPGAAAVVQPPALPPDALTTPIHVARGGGYIYEGIDDARLKQLILTGDVLGTDHYFRHGMKNWMRVSQYAMMMGIPL